MIWIELAIRALEGRAILDAPQGQACSRTNDR